MEEPKAGPPLNRNAVLSLALAALTVLSFCLGVAPIPGTDLICYSASLLFGLVALGLGSVALFEIRRSGEGGRWLAWIGITIGALTVLAGACLLGLIGLTLPYLQHALQQLWIQIRH